MVGPLPFIRFIQTYATTVLAAQTIANIVKSSLGPLGLDKMLVDNIGVCLLGFLHPSSCRLELYPIGSHNF